MTAMDIKTPRRVLAVSLTDSSQHLSKIVGGLTGTTPEPNSGTESLAGTTQILSLKTAYYQASVPIWLDLVSSPAEWSTSFLSDEAKEVLDVLGGVVVVFPLPPSPPKFSSTSSVANDSPETQTWRELIRHVGKVVKEGLGGWDWDGVGLCVGVGDVDDVDEWEDCAAEFGLEFVQAKTKGGDERNEFGEKTGVARVIEALEANDWSQLDIGGDLGSEFGDFEEPVDADDTDPTGGLGPELDPENLSFGFDREDFAGLKHAILTAGLELKDNNHTRHKNGVESDRDVGAKGDTVDVDGKGKNDDTDKNVDAGGDADLDDEAIQKIEGMMRRLQAVRDMSAGFPEDQRKKMAARAVGEVMKEL